MQRLDLFKRLAKAVVTQLNNVFFEITQANNSKRTYYRANIVEHQGMRNNS